jgi:hypothetical protein
MTQHRIDRRSATLVIAAASLGLFTSMPEAAAGPSPREIMDKVTQTRKLSGSEAVVKMTIADGKGGTRARELSMATKLYDGGATEKRIYTFVSPADVKGTGILVFDYPEKADDVWIYMPAMRKTRRITSSQRSQAFMGSEFSFGDLNIPALDEFNYTLVKEESFDGENCYVIEAVPKTKEIAAEDGYSKKTYWVSKDKFVVRKGLYLDKDNKPLKELVCKDIKLLDDKNKRYRAMKMEMTNLQNGRKSTFESTKVAFSPDVKDDYFTTRYLERT